MVDLNDCERSGESRPLLATTASISADHIKYEEEDLEVYLTLPGHGESPSEEEEPTKQDPHLTPLGYFFAIIAGLCFTASNVFIK